MGKLKTPQRTEPLDFLETPTIDDGAGGTTAGPEEVAHRCLVSWRPIKASKLLEANQDSLRQAYLFEFWVNPNYEPKLGQSLRFRDERLTNQGFRYVDDTRKRYELTALEQIGTTNG